MTEKSNVHLGHDSHNIPIHPPRKLSSPCAECTYVSSDHISRYIMLKSEWQIIVRPCRRDRMSKGTFAITDNGSNKIEKICELLGLNENKYDHFHSRFLSYTL